MTRDEALKKLIKTIISRFHSEIDRAVLRAAQQIYDNDLKTPSSKAEKKRFDKIFKDLNDSAYNYIKSGFQQSWNLSNNYYDGLVNQYLGGKIVSDIISKSYMAHNLEAAAKLWSRKVDGMNISERVWNISQGTREAIEVFVSSDIGQGFLTGRSASETATLLKEYLREPDKRFRRIRDKETGKLEPSKPMSDYHPGQGVYKSSYKNALRLAATETNMAYHMAGHERAQRLDFVVGIEVVLSENHPDPPDICDEMAGEYPKEFVFRSWHPNCLCTTKDILLPEKEFDKYLSGEVDNVDQLKSDYVVLELPENAVSYLKGMQETFNGYKNKPYFLVDNFKDGNINKGTRF
jgi:hypothetical protein